MCGGQSLAPLPLHSDQRGILVNGDPWTFSTWPWECVQCGMQDINLLSNWQWLDFLLSIWPLLENILKALMLKYDQLKTSFVKPVYNRLVVVVAFSCMLLFLWSRSLCACIYGFIRESDVSCDLWCHFGWRCCERQGFLRHRFLHSIILFRWKCIGHAGL